MPNYGVEGRIRKAYALLQEREKIEAQIKKMFGTFSSNGHSPTRKKNLRAHGAYLVAVKRLPKAKRNELKRIYQEQGVRAAVRAAQAEVEKL